VFQSGWRKKVEELIKTKAVVSFNSNIVTVGCIRRDYIDRYLFWPEYIHYWCDMEMGEVARRDRQYVELKGYFHVLPKTGGMGHVSPEMDKWDEDTYRMRESLGFPREYVRDMKERNKIAYEKTLPI
jgi:hypothetical protein